MIDYVQLFFFFKAIRFGDSLLFGQLVDLRATMKVKMIDYSRNCCLRTNDRRKKKKKIKLTLFVSIFRFVQIEPVNSIGYNICSI